MRRAANTRNQSYAARWLVYFELAAQARLFVPLPTELSAALRRLRETLGLLEIQD